MKKTNLYHVDGAGISLNLIRVNVSMELLHG